MSASSRSRGTLYVVVCAAPAAASVDKLVRLAQGAGWLVRVSERRVGSIRGRGQSGRGTVDHGVRGCLAGAGTDALAEIFTPASTYLQGPFEEPVTGLPAIGRMWEGERDGPEEVFHLASDIIAVDGDTAVVRAEIRYGDPVTQEYRDLWLVRFDADGRCAGFEEWPFWPGKPLSAAPARAEPATRPAQTPARQPSG